MDAIYQTNLLLKSNKALAQQTVKEMEARDLQDAPTDQNDLVHFVLHLLLQQLIVLYFDVQEHAKHSLDTIISLEDFYLSELHLPLSVIQPLQKMVCNKVLKMLNLQLRKAKNSTVRINKLKTLRFP